jgi:hypothetical protein
MNRLNLFAAVALVAAAFTAGCSIPNPGTVRQLGNVNYDTTLDTARQVFAKYYSIESVDPDKGVIISSPKDHEGPSGRIFAKETSVREIATMRVTRTDKGVMAQVSVEVQKLGTDAIRQSTLTGENYSEVPDKSPAQGEAANTYEQSQTWFFDHYNKGEEGKILADLYSALHSGGTATSAPAAPSPAPAATTTPCATTSPAAAGQPKNSG